MEHALKKALIKLKEELIKDQRSSWIFGWMLIDRRRAGFKYANELHNAGGGDRSGRCRVGRGADKYGKKSGSHDFGGHGPVQKGWNKRARRSAQSFIVVLCFAWSF